MAASAITSSVSSTEVAKANALLRKMRASLVAWLKYRRMNDEVASGARPTSKPRAIAMQYAQARDWQTEQKLADQLHALLSEMMPEAQLPDPSVSANPNAAVELAQIAITGQPPKNVVAPQAQGASPPWLWPVLIVGAVMFSVTTAISSMADVAKTKEQYACIQAGACTDYGFWLKVGGIAMLGWFLWTQTGIKDTVRSLTSPRSRKREG